jgi:hypothetical protein
MKNNNILKIIGAFIFIFGIFFLLLSITNIFNDLDFIEQYNNCIEVSKYEPAILDVCKANVSDGLNIAIRTNQVELTTGQYLKIYIKQIIGVLFAVLMIIIGDYIYVASRKQEKENKKEVLVKKPIIKKTTKRKKK